MMKRLNFLNTREVKKIREQVIVDFGFFPKGDYAFLKSDKDRLFIVNKDVAKLELKNLRIDRMGLYLGEVKPNQIRLSKEGAQLIVRLGGNKVTNIVEINEEEVKEYFQGNDLIKDLGEKNRLIILKHKKEILGCASYKEGKILNFLPKIHRGTVIV
ncbi:hypothetical protein HOD05_00280 [Candidatus Woesearchaeota archaeon]|jgi:NOL1/NOP2/fmu family ribosome biogenesis protein|nr:hypothetical protein [Candidatus Woesearchaeota archaeon]MBT4150847.1 hypothetical protein [Candidatus Woesearchaeota archaeon]MBT4246952.1 hypothetical protein [Candidatus Woesearchaeota archaeon]MBT4433637.1 hypothetical protein [Candidatus Woesearchaeota archaeon]MBT7332589.1 hypothetical protein [Candidatus Woesearchaeota archaeon]